MPVVSEVSLSSLMDAVLPLPPNKLKSTFKTLLKGDHMKYLDSYDTMVPKSADDPTVGVYFASNPQFHI
ncbi:hypothetical protein ACGC1H_003502 [Rhizoctonia solani]